jgi:histidine ammonia-lyase
MTTLIDGSTMDCHAVAAVALDRAAVRLDPAALARAEATAAEVNRRLAEDQPVYGRTTGVGANRGVTASADGHGTRLLGSHQGGGGPRLGPAAGRAMLVVRLNQLAAGGAGVRPALLGRLADRLGGGPASPGPPLYSAIGTADLSALAELAAGLPVDDGDALAFMSSNALTLGRAALACHALHGLLDATLVVAALSAVAVGASSQPYAPAVQAARRHPGQVATAARMRRLLGNRRGRRIQDSYGFRALPQVHGPAVDAGAHLHEVLSVELNARAENPLVDPGGGAIVHNGNFHAQYLTSALDTVRAALVHPAALSAARLAALLEPATSGLPAFLAVGPDGSSGLMILEYTAHAALGELRQQAIPAGLGGAVISRGAEEHASFAPQAVLSMERALTAYPVVLATELVASVRALRLGGVRVPAALRAPFDRADAALPAGFADRALTEDVAVAASLLTELA